ncbi:MAG: BTAD domain-containing putative transcriptional regulator [Actinomycetota bacterium]
MEFPLTRPFRVHPPSADGALLRPDLLRLLLGRFEARLTIVRAGAGFGKSTALAQAVEQNALAPRGHDRWIGCDPADVDGDHLRRGIGESLGIVGDATVEIIAEAVAAYSPAQVCLIFDDTHEIPADSSGAEVLAALLASLPSNGHLLLAGRSAPPLAVARLDAQHQVVRIEEADLTLSDADLRTLSDLAGREPADVAHLGGWPALVALGLRSGPVPGFLNEEVLGSLDESQRTLLATMVALGGASAAMLHHLTGIEPAQPLADLPMVQHQSGWYRAHDLWNEVFDPTLIAECRAEQLRPAVDFLLEQGQTVRAVDLALRGDQNELAITALRAALIGGRVEDQDILRRWSSMTGPAMERHPVTSHLRGLLEQSIDPTTERCRAHFAAAADGFAAMGDLTAQVSSVAELGFWHHIQRDAPGLVQVAGTMMELAAAGEPSAGPYVDMIGAFAALSQGDPHTMLAAVGKARAATMTGRFEAIADWLELQAKEFLGESDVELADRYLDSAGAIRGTEVIAISARWRAGRIEELLADPDAFGARSGSERARFLSHAWLAAVSAGVGRLEDAKRHLTSAEAFAGERGAKQVELTLALPQILVTHEEGRRDDAEQEMRALVERIPLADDTRLSYNGSGALICRIDPTAHAALRVPLPERDTSLGLALHEMDQRGDVTPLVTVPWPENPGKMISSLFLRTSCEFVAAAWAADRPEARSAAQWLLDVVGDPARERFRDHTEHEIKAVAKAAKEILASVPLPPVEPRRLRLLGPEVLLLGDVESEHDDWRRERVRSLVGFLVVHPDTTRDAVMAALWPDADEEAGRRNLRSTLNLLLGVLEEGRTGGDAAYFVRADSSRIRLGGHDRLDVDVWRFDQLLQEAELLERDGAPTLALDRLLTATELYRGDLLSGIQEGEWLHVERQRLHVRFVAAAVRAGELLLAHDRNDEAIALASRTITVEPWSEPAHATLVAAHLQRGDRAAARRAMQRCHEVLDELGGPVEELTLMLERRLSGADA